MTFVHPLEIDQPLALVEQEQTSFYLPDRLGSIVAMADEAGEIVTRYGYDPFGRCETTGEPTDNPLRFTARFHDPESGLYYYRARYYDSELGVFFHRTHSPRIWTNRSISTSMPTFATIRSITRIR